MSDQHKTTIWWGSFSVRQKGITVASGDGPFFDVVKEAQHYAGIYRQDGPVRVTVRRLKDRVVETSDV